MAAGDIDEVLEIEQSSQPSPWPARLFLEELDRDWAYVDVVRVQSPDLPQCIVAFCNYWLVGDEVHLLNLATRPDWRRHGIATRLINHLVAFAHANQCCVITLEVRKSNHPAQALYSAHGFASVGVRPRYYADRGEDAVVMTLDLKDDQRMPDDLSSR